MARRRHTPEQVINKLREAEVAIAEGKLFTEGEINDTRSIQVSRSVYQELACF